LDARCPEDDVQDLSDAEERRALPPHNMFPNLRGSRPSHFKGQPSTYGAALSGNSQLLPNPADWMQRDHRVAVPGNTQAHLVVY